MKPTSVINTSVRAQTRRRESASPSQLSIVVKITDADVHRQRERNDDDETAKEIVEEAGHGKVAEC